MNNKAVRSSKKTKTADVLKGHAGSNTKYADKIREQKTMKPEPNYSNKNNLTRSCNEWKQRQILVYAVIQRPVYTFIGVRQNV